MKKGLMVVNAFLQNNKFNEIYLLCQKSAEKQNMQLELATNADLMALAPNFETLQNNIDFVLFWDKDIFLAKQLEMAGFRLFNSAKGIEICDDKALSYLALKNSNVPMPQTILAPKTFSQVGYTTLAFVEDAIKQLELPLVVKENCGSFGAQVHCFNTQKEIEEWVFNHAGIPFLFQKLIKESYGEDIRVNMVGDKPVASMLRKNSSGGFHSNLTLGGIAENYILSKEEELLAKQTMQSLSLDFAGIDILRSNNGPIICEVNSNPHFATTLACTNVNVADCIMQYITNKLL